MRIYYCISPSLSHMHAHNYFFKIKLYIYLFSALTGKLDTHNWREVFIDSFEMGHNCELIYDYKRYVNLLKNAKRICLLLKLLKIYAGKYTYFECTVLK